MEGINQFRDGVNVKNFRDDIEKIQVAIHFSHQITTMQHLGFVEVFPSLFFSIWDSSFISRVYTNLRVLKPEKNLLFQHFSFYEHLDFINGLY